MTALSPDVAVIGAGAFGAWTALRLAELGARVKLVDMYGPGNDRSSSGGESRNFRAAYGDNQFYTEWALTAWDLWLARQEEFGARLVYQNGSLRAGGGAEIAGQVASFRALAAPFEVLSSDEVSSRWPQVCPSDDQVFYEPASGILAATRTLYEVARAFIRLGGVIVRGHAELGGDAAAPALTVEGAPLHSETIVFACGPWLPLIFRNLLQPLIRTPRRELVFVAPAKGDNRFGWERCPNLVDALGWTSADIGNGVKIAPPMKGIDMNPDNDSRILGDKAIQGAQLFLAARLPALTDVPVIGSYVSQLENTASEDFLIDRHPDNSRIVLAGGGSGHAFKFGPLLGDYVARLVLNGGRGEHAARFGLDAHRPLKLGEGG